MRARARLRVERISGDDVTERRPRAPGGTCLIEHNVINKPGAGRLALA